MRTGIPVRSSPKQFNGGSPRTLPLGSLVDYDEGDEVGVENAAPASPGVPGRGSPVPGGFIPVGYSPSPSDAPPASPRIAHRQVSVKSPLTPEEDGDILEALSKGGPLLPKLPGGPDASVGSKRRRDDDDDEMLERLANKAKRPTPSPSSPKEDAESSPGVARAAPTKTSEEGPKKLKLKIGAVGAAVANSAPSSTNPSSTGTKDGDNG